MGQATGIILAKQLLPPFLPVYPSCTGASAGQRLMGSSAVSLIPSPSCLYFLFRVA